MDGAGPSAEIPATTDTRDAGMRQSNTSTGHRSFRGAALVGLLAALTIGLTAYAGAEEPSEPGASTTVHRAIRGAERAAAARTSLDRLEESDPSTAAGPVGEAAKGIGPAKLGPLPEDWQEAGLSLERATLEDGAYVQTLEDGLQVELTIDPVLQRHVEEIYDDYDVPHGGLAMLEPRTGRVLALVSHTDHDPRIPKLARRSVAPAASTFKIVTAAALLESTDVTPHGTFCYHGGASYLTEENITGDPKNDSRCEELGDALAYSINSIFARLTYHRLDGSTLRTWAERFAYNREIPFELDLEQPSVEVVQDRLEQARTAAGFWHSYTSPLHGALMAASVANDGLMMEPSIIEEVRTSSGEVLETFEPRAFRRVMKKETADTLDRLLERTTTKGTADSYFARRAAFPNDVRAAGKTGTLAKEDPYMSFTWFVGFARHRVASDRRAAVGSVVGNTPTWRIKGPWVASDALRKYFQLRQQRADSGESGSKVARR